MIQLKHKVLNKNEISDETPKLGLVYLFLLVFSCTRVYVCMYVWMYILFLLLNASLCSRLCICECCVVLFCVVYTCVCVLLRALYISVHLIFLRFDLSLARPLVVLESSVFRERISRIKSKNTLSTFSRVFADVSTYGTPHC